MKLYCGEQLFHQTFHKKDKSHCGTNCQCKSKIIIEDGKILCEHCRLLIGTFTQSNLQGDKIIILNQHGELK